MTSDLTGDLLGALGEDGFLALTEAYGGLRLYVLGDHTRSELSTVIGVDHAARLSKSFGGAYIRVPIGRELRAARYREAGSSNREIARKLGMTETGVDHLIRRARNKDPAKFARKKDPRQIEMFD